MRRHFSPALLLALSTLAAPASAQVNDEPWYAGGAIGWTQVSNVYRVSANATPNDDQLRSATLLAGAQLRLGRQRLKLDARASQNDYRRNRDLRHLAYNGSAAWDWVLGSRLSGSLSTGAQRSLAPFNPGNAPVTTEKNIERSERVRLYARYGLVGLWSVDGAIGANRRDYSVALYDPYDYRQRSADLGLRWQPGAELNLRLGLREARGSYPRFRRLAGGEYQADRFTRQDVDASLWWTPSPQNQLNLRLSHGRSEHSEAGARDYKGNSGRLEWLWSPSARLQFQTVLSRDSGDDSRQIDLGQFGSIGSVSSRVYNSLQWQAAYALTAKLTLDASLGQTERELTDLLGASSRTGKDRTRTASLGARWAFDRKGSLGCQWATDRRRGAAEFSLPYEAESVGCSVQYMLR